MSTKAHEHTPTFWAAPDLAKAGYPVLPMKGKEPSVEGGFYAGTTDLSQIAAWIEEGRGHHDVAFATGLPSGVVVIDADSSEAFEEMRASYGEPAVLTRRGGHWYFRHPRNGKAVSNKVRAGLDRKGDGGLVAAPPSRGRKWTNGIPNKTLLPVLPQEFWPKRAEKSEAVRSLPAELKDHAAEIIARYVAKISPGPDKGRHEHLRHLCGVLLSRSVAFGDAEDVLCGAWAKAGGELAERAPREVPNTLRTTEQALADDQATGVPSLEGITPGLYAELEAIFGWKVCISIGGQERNGQGEAPSGAGEEKKRRNQADRLIDYALAPGAQLFCDQMGAPHVLVDNEAVPLNTRSYNWLRGLMWDTEGISTGGEALKTAGGTLAAFAAKGGKVRELHTRAAFHKGVVYYQLGPGRVVKIDRDGWRLEENPPVVFRSIPNLKPLPDPEAGGSLEGLEELVNLKTARDKRMFKVYAVTLPLPHIPRPILQTTGVMGSGKTTAGRVVKRLLDPTSPESVRMDPRDFLQKASHSYIVMLDNLNSIPEWGVDTLCRLVTGEADSKRSLYTDDEDFIYEMKRAVLLNGINPPTERGDAQDRTLPVELDRIPDNKRRSEESLWAAFGEEHGKTLGAIFDALAATLREKEALQLSKRPRLADWGEYAAAAYKALGWGVEAFLEDWEAVVKIQNQGTLDGSSVAQAVLSFMESRNEWTGLANDLHAKLEVEAEELNIDVKKDKTWPKAPSWLWRRMREVLPLLTAMGIEATQKHGDTGSKILLTKVGKGPDPGPDGNPDSTEENAVRDAVRENPAQVSAIDRTDSTDSICGHSSTPLSRTREETSVEESGNGSKSHAGRKLPKNTVSAGSEVAEAGKHTEPATVGELFENPPNWLRLQVEKHLQDPAERTLKPLCTAVATELYSNAFRGTEIRSEVEEALGRWSG